MTEQEEIEDIGQLLALRELTIVIDPEGRVTFSDLPGDVLDVARRISGEDMSDIFTMGAVELANAMAKKEISPVEVTQAFLQRIQAVEPRVQAFLHVDPDRALEQAQQQEKQLLQGNAGSLAGVPVAVKDIFNTKDMPTTAGSRILEGFRPPFDATVVQKLRSQGAVLLGKTNMDEFAMGSTGENSAFQVTKNPWDLKTSPGGSSGGSAAAVAAMEAPLAVGTDTGGSIRQPAALCGITGLKPTYGRVSRYGIIAFASSLDQAGPMARTVKDTALLMRAMAGHDNMDSTSLTDPVPDYVAGLNSDLSGKTVGIISGLMGLDGVDQAVKDNLKQAVDALKAHGAEVREVTLPHADYCIATYYIIATAEASSNLARYDGVRYGMRVEPENGDLEAMYRATRGQGFGREVKRRIILGTFVLSSGYNDAYYQRALRARTLIRKDFEAVFRDVDLLLLPTSPVAAVGLGQLSDPLSMYLLDVFTVCVNLAGLPGINVPVGLDPGGHPVGMQLVGPYLGEQGVLNGALALEEEMDFHKNTAGIKG